jgi:O6-methylguanine-DNA--protein-cysteine methyltransferase
MLNDSDNLYRVCSGTPLAGWKKGTGGGPNAGDTKGDVGASKDKSPRESLDQRLYKGGIITQAEHAAYIAMIRPDQNGEKLQKKREVDAPLEEGSFAEKVEKALNELSQEVNGLITYKMIAVKLGNPNSALAVANAMTILWHHYYIFSD